MNYRFTQNSACIFILAISFGLAAPTSADEIEASKSVAEELLDILRAAGTIGDAQYLELRDRARAEEQQRIKTAVEAAVEAAADTARLAAVSAAPPLSRIPKTGISNGTTASSFSEMTEPSISSLAAVSRATGR
jgi:hypothetical protein